MVNLGIDLKAKLKAGIPTPILTCQPRNFFMVGQIDYLQGVRIVHIELSVRR